MDLGDHDWDLNDHDLNLDDQDLDLGDHDLDLSDHSSSLGAHSFDQHDQDLDLNIVFVSSKLAIHVQVFVSFASSKAVSLLQINEKLNVYEVSIISSALTIRD